MTEDENAIQTVIDTWMSAVTAGDLATVLSLMTDDVIFMVPGREPFGKKEFAVDAQGMKDAQIKGKHNILEIQVLGDWAWLRSHLDITMTPAGGGAAVHRAGYILTLMH